MQIYTGYFAKTKKYSDAGIVPVGISGKLPEWWKYRHYRQFAPSWSIWKEWHDSQDTARNERYAVRFQHEILNRLRPDDVLRDLSAFGKNLVLCCYETPDKFCHRHLVAQWIEKHLKIEVTEYYI
jgi:uncharacterized protein YeaO (DUF488 family)